MFNKENKKTEEKENNHNFLEAEDMIIHNMPTPAKIDGGGASLSGTKSESAGFVNSSPAKNNSKVVGLIIILFGLAFIIGLVYLTYRFVIAPAANPNKQITEQPSGQEINDKDKNDKDGVEGKSQESQIVEEYDEALSLETDLSTDAAVVAPLLEADFNEDFVETNRNLSPVLDFDSDGLTDDEEDILGTKLEFIDSDDDGYIDLAEFTNGYNPAGAGKLEDNVNLAIYNSPAGYTLFHPKKWPINSVNGGLFTTFTAPDESIIQVSIQDKPSGVSGILGWYESYFPYVTVTYDNLENVDNWDGIMGEDQANFYLTNRESNKIFIISYIPSSENRFAYPNIFRMFINYFKIN